MSQVRGILGELTDGHLVLVGDRATAPRTVLQRVRQTIDALVNVANLLLIARSQLSTCQ